MRSILIVFLFLLSPLYAGDYSPYVRVHNKGYEMVWSGVVIKESGGNILTVGHPFFGRSADQINMEVEFVKDGGVVAKSARLIKYDYHRDLGILKVEGVEELADPVDLAETRPPIGANCCSNGYVMFEPMRKEKCFPLSFTSHSSLDSNKQTLFVGRAVIGLSGSAIVYDNKIVSIQSSGLDNMSKIIGSDIDEIKFFLSDKWE